MTQIITESSGTGKENYHNLTHHSRKSNKNINQFNSLFSSVKLFSSQSSLDDTVPRSAPIRTITTIEQISPCEYEPIPQTKFKTIIDVQSDQPKVKDMKSDMCDGLPIFMTFTNHGRCSLDSDISDVSKTDPRKKLKTMVQFVYGPQATQIGLKPLPLKLPQMSTDLEPNYQLCPNNNGFYSIRLTPFLESMKTKSILFSPMVRIVGPNSQLVIVRNTKYVQQIISDVNSQYHPIMFESNSISRVHGYFKVDQYGNWYIQDVESKSGTFLNHNRLSKSSTISNDFLLQNGDVIQLGMTPNDEEIKSDNYKCVRMKVELNDSWKLNKLQMREVFTQRLNSISNPQKEETCSICLYPCHPCQSIFLAPCAHCWHFNCIKPLMFKNYPHFVCPNCRAIIDLEEDRSVDED